jgi:hypothetical protein
MSDKLRFNIRALTVPPTLPHKTRAEEVAELPKYLEVSALIAPELVLMNMGEQEPGSDRSDFPWIRLNSSGEPQGLFVNVGGTWQPAFSKLTVRSNLEDIVMESGSASIIMNVAADTVKEYSSSFAFSKAFDDAPKMFISISGGTILGTGSGTTHGAYTRLWVPSAKITDSEFTPSFISNQNTAVTSQTLEFTWIAVGKRSDT